MRIPSRIALAATLLATACLAASPPGASAGPARPMTAGPAHAAAAASAARAPSKVLVFVEENHSLAQLRTGMPYLDRLALRKYAYAVHYRAITHPSLPNYLAIAGGSTFGVRNDAGPTSNAPKVGHARSVFDEAIHRGFTAKTYAESMPTHCDANSAGKYAVKHNPWVYFKSGRHNCRKYDVPMGTPRHGALARNIASGHLPNVGLAIPNLCDDAHSCSLSVANRWLHGWLPSILHTSAFRSGRLAVVVTTDESEGSGPNTVMTVVLHAPGRGGRAVTTRLSHYSLSKFLSSVSGARALRHARHAHGLGHAFGL
jgi:hypothetical protein